MDKFLMTYIDQRMNEMGYPNYHFEPVRVMAGWGLVQVPAYNEFYFLVSKMLPAAMIIYSDTNIFNEAVGYGDYNFYQVQEFTGLIELEYVSEEFVSVEFVKVVPTCCNEVVPKCSN